MNRRLRVIHRYVSSTILFLMAPPLVGQELEPGAYSISPAGVNIFVISNNLSGGDVTFDPTLPIEDAKATINVTALGYFRSLSLMGRSANLSFALPYTLGNLEGQYLGEFRK